MTSVVLLTAANLVPDAPHRRADAWQFDIQLKILAEAFAEEGIKLSPRSWTGDAGWGGWSAALVLTAWDYQDRPDDFLSRIDELEAAGVPVFNPPSLVRWNIRKTYLRQLEARGVLTIPTLWPDAPTRTDVDDAFAAFAADQVVLKRQVGAGARGQQMFRRGDAIPDGALLDRAGMIQPYIPAIAEEGEFSFLFVEGAFSHALVKRAARGDYRIQAAYGGVAHATDPSPEDRAQAQIALGALDQTPLYARVDMVRGDDGRLMLMELEVIEPNLFPEQGRQIGPMLAKALRARLK